jgi:hypothetical protein
VYQIDGIPYTPPIAMGVKSASVRQVKPVRDANGNWIGTNNVPMPNRQKVYSQLVVEKDESGTSVQNMYTDKTVSAMISAINV